MRFDYRTVKYGEDGPEMADVYLAYGKALLENAIQQAGVLGKEQKPGEDADDDKGEWSLVRIVSVTCGAGHICCAPLQTHSLTCVLTI